MANENEERFELPLNHLFICPTKEDSAHLKELGLNAIYNPHPYGEWTPSFENSLEGSMVFILQGANGGYEAKLCNGVLNASMGWKSYQKIVVPSEVCDLSRDKLLEAVRKSFLEEEFRKPGIDLHVTTLKDVFQYEPPEFIVTDIVVKGWSHLLTGAQGDCKSVLSLAVCKSILTGDSLFGKYAINEQGPVLIVDEENPGSLLRDRAEKMGLNEKLPLYFLHFQQVRLDDDDCLYSLVTAVEKIGPVLIIFDSLIRLHRQDENSSSQMARVMGGIRRIANMGKTCWIIHHQGHPKSGPQRSKSRGSTDIIAGVDIEYSLKKSGDVLTLDTGKTRIEKFGPIKLNFTVTDTMEIAYAGESSGEFDDAVRSEILAALNRGGKEMSFEEIWEELKNRGRKVGENKLRLTLSRLYDEKKINRGEQKIGKTKQFVYRI